MHMLSLVVSLFTGQMVWLLSFLATEQALRW